MGVANGGSAALRVLAWCLALGLGAPWCAAQQAGLGARHHPWGRFQPGAWKLVRAVTETLDHQGLVMNTSVTETKTTLVKIDSDGVVLEVEVGIEVAGKEFDGQPQCIKQGFHGELTNSDARVQPPVPAQVVVDDRKIDCFLQKIEFSGPHGRTTTNLYYCDSVVPYVLKRESTTTDTDGKEVLGTTTMEVVALEMPQKVLSEIKNAACLKIVQKQPKGTVVTLAMTTSDVPGGVVSHLSKETDKDGRIVCRSNLELIAYGTQPEKERTGLFGRKRPPRIRKPAPYTPPQ
jgi:hypothetical protein